MVSNTIMVWKEADNKFGWCSLNDNQMQLIARGILDPDDMKINGIYVNSNFEKIEKIENNEKFKSIAKTILYE